MLLRNAIPKSVCVLVVGQYVGIAFDKGFLTLGLKIKMAAAKPEVVIARLIYHLGIKFQRLCLCFHSRSCVGIASNREFVTLGLEIKMATAKPEVVIARLAHHLGMKFQRLWLCFRSPPICWNSFR